MTQEARKRIFSFLFLDCLNIVNIWVDDWYNKTKRGLQQTKERREKGKRNLINRLFDCARWSIFLFGFIVSQYSLIFKCVRQTLWYSYDIFWFLFLFFSIIIRMLFRFNGSTLTSTAILFHFVSLALVFEKRKLVSEKCPAAYRTQKKNVGFKLSDVRLEHRKKKNPPGSSFVNEKEIKVKSSCPLKLRMKPRIGLENTLAHTEEE